MPYLGKTPSQGVRSRYQFTPNAGATSLSGADANGDTLTFTDGNYVDVYLNGVMLKAGVDYVTTTANTIGSLVATVANDVVDIIVYDTFSLFGGTLEGNVKVNNGTLNVTGATDLDSTLNVDGNATFGGTINTTGTSKLQFGDTGTYIHQSADGVLDLVSDTEIEINATTVDVNGQLYLIRADGESDNEYIATFKNEEATDDRSYGVLIHAGSTNTDRALTINDHDGSTALFYVAGNGNTGVNMTPDSSVKLSVNGAVGPTNGSNSAPTHTFYSDPDTGMYRSGANALSFTTGGTAALTLDSSQNSTFAGDVSLADNKKATFGGGDDLEIYYDGTDAYIRNHSGGRIIQRARTGFLLQTNATGGGADNAITANQAGSVELTYNNAKKFETTSSGVTVTGVTTSTGFSGKIHPVSGTTTNYLSLKDGNELNFFNSSDAPQTLYINYDTVSSAGGNLDLSGSAVSVVHSANNSEPTVTVKGGGTGYTHGAIALKSSTGDDPRVRGQGIYLFNEENDTTWYVGTPYANSSAGNRPFDFSFESGTTSLSAITASGDSTASGQSLTRCKVRIHADGVISAPSGIELGDGIDNTAAHTLDAYEEGTWTMTDQSGASLSLTVYVAEYTKIGNKVFFEIGMVMPTTSDTNDLSFSLPFTAKSTNDNTGGAAMTTTSSGRNDTIVVVRNQARLTLSTTSNVGVTNNLYSAKQIRCAGFYTIA